METLNYIFQKFWKIDYIAKDIDAFKMPIEIPNYGRNQLAELFAELGFTKGAEIGTEQGVYSEILLSANPSLTLYSIDAWHAYKGYRDHTRQEKLDRFYQTTVNRLSNYDFSPLGKRSYIIRKFSLDALVEFENESLDFVYIDANHDFMNVTMDIHAWSKKVRKGGIISGHDYIKRKDQAAGVHVKQVLQGYTDAYNIKPWFVLGSDAVVEGEIRDSSRSWMFVKE